MKDKEGNKFFIDKEKCNLMELTGNDGFKITEKEEKKIDKLHTDHINRYEYISVNNNRVKSHPTANTSRLNTGNYHTIEITLDEIKTYIRRSKNKAPASTKINKQILEKCTEKNIRATEKYI